MAQRKTTHIRAHLQELSDRELAEVLEIRTEEYTADALIVAEQEAERRGGLRALRDTVAARGTTRRPSPTAKRWAEVSEEVDTWFDWLVGEAPGPNPDALDYVRIGLRLSGLLFAALAVALLLYTPFTGFPAGLIASLPLLLSLGLLILATFGGSEAIRVIKDLRTEVHRLHERLDAEEQEPKPTAPPSPDESS
jgi:hypothetical protein